jgi:hypothetical protein
MFDPPNPIDNIRWMLNFAGIDLYKIKETIRHPLWRAEAIEALERLQIVIKQLELASSKLHKIKNTLP